MSNPFAALTAYELSHLVAHLVSAGHGSDVHRLLAMETVPARANAWFEVREHQGDAAGYLNDVNRAWEDAEARAGSAPNPAGLARLLALQVHYALVTSSLSTLAEARPANLRARLLEIGLWTPARAVADARRLRVEGERAEGLAALIEWVHGEDRAAVLTETVSLVQGNRLHWLVPLLAEHLAEPLRTQVGEQSQIWIGEADWTVEPTERPDRSAAARVSALEEAVKRIADSDVRPEAVQALQEAVAASRPGSTGSIPTILTAAAELPQVQRRRVLDDLAVHIPPDLLPEAARLAGLVGDALEVLADFASLEPFLSEPAGRRLRELLEAQPEGRYRAVAIGRLAAASGATPDDRREALRAVIGTEPVTDDPYRDLRRVEALVRLAVVLGDPRDPDPEAARAGALESARGLENLRYRGEALCLVAGIEPSESVRAALISEAVQGCRDDGEDAEPPAMQALDLLNLARRLPGPDAVGVVTEAEAMLRAQDPEAATLSGVFRESLLDLASLVKAGLRVESSSATAVPERTAALRELLDRVGHLGRVGLYLSAYVERPSALASIGRKLPTLPPPQGDELLRAALRMLAGLSRTESVPGVAALAPALVALGGDDVADGLVDSLGRVLTWWP